MVYSFTSVWGLNYEFMEEDKPRRLNRVGAPAGHRRVLVGTTTGLHLVFKAADRWVPGLEIGKVTGGWRDLTLDNVRYEQPGVAVTAGQFHLSVRLRCLWDSSLCVNDIALRDIYVAVDTKKMPPSAPVEEEDSGPLNLSTPYPITLSRVALHNVNVKIDDTAVSVRDFSTGLNWREKI